MPKKRRLIIIDSNALIHRAYHALPPLTTKNGEIVNAVYGFLLVLFKAIKDLNPDYIAATFDLAAPTFRHEKFKEYKAKRPKAPDELYGQIPKIKEFLRAMNIPIYEKEGFEADDIIGTIAKLASKKMAFPELETIILTSDLDALQLINKNTKVYTFRKGIKDSVIYDEKRVQERYNLKPEQLVDFRGLKGDPSDNIPGAPGIGEKTAADLIKKFGTIEKLYEALEKNLPASKNISPKIKEKLIQAKEQVLFSRLLSKIRLDAPIELKLEAWRSDEQNQEEAKRFLKKFEFFSLLARLPQSSKELAQKGKENLSSLEEPFASRAKKSDRNREKETLEEIEKLYTEGGFSEKIYNLEKALVPVVGEIEKNGIKIDIARLKNLSEKMKLKIKAFEGKIHNLAGREFNINSPQQLSEVLFVNLKLPTQGLKKTPGGVISTSRSELEKLKEQHPIIKILEGYRELFKLKSGFVDALPQLIGEDGRLHPELHQLGTATGRFSCSNPNLQNIPIKGEFGREIRKAFVSEEGFELISADYSQMELRVAAVISQDKKMIGFFDQGKDVHRMTASNIFNIPENRVGEKERSLAKTINFGVLYGMSVVGLAEAAGIQRNEAKKFIGEYFNDFKGIANYVKNSISKARKKGFSETLFGRKRFLPEINSIDFRLRQAAERMAINHPVQGTSADIIKMAMVKIYQKSNIENQGLRMILQVHDELLFEAAEEKVREFAEEIKKIMENIVKFKVPLKVDIKTGDNWGELEEFNPIV